MQKYFENNNSEELILLFSGWGMDEKPFIPIKSDCDILHVFDYSNLELDFKFDFLSYKKITLLSFSAGVFMAGFLKDMLPEIDYKIAVNGTLAPFDCQEGMSKEMLSMIENITMETVFDFRKYLVEKEEHLKLFGQYQPSRSLESSLKEFSALQKYFRLSGKPDFNYDKVIISKNDKIITAENQLRAWNNHKNIRLIEGGHFPFYEFLEFKDIL